MSENPSCASCSHYRPPKAAPEEASPLQVRELANLRGVCQRLPTSLPKLAHEVCGEHPRFALLRDLQLAGLIADKLLGEDTASGKRKLFAGRG